MKRALLLLLVVGCVEEKGQIKGTQSIYVELVSPSAATPNDVNNRLPPTLLSVTVNVAARNAEGEVDTTFKDITAYPECNPLDEARCPCRPYGEIECGPLRIYAQFLGTLTPELNELPIATISMTNGVATNQVINLPAIGGRASVYGPTTLWFDNGRGVGPEYQFGAVTGNSPTLWFRDPFVEDLQRPANETSLDALSITPLSDKQVRVGGSRHGATGALVVTSTFAQGYTVSDVKCAAGGPRPTPPCTAEAYDHVMVFTFSAPRDQFGARIEDGEVVESFNGGLSEFNGLTEVGFPRTFIPLKPNTPDGDRYVDPALMPAPVPIHTCTAGTAGTCNWFGGVDNSAACRDMGQCNGRINFERNEAGAIEILNAKVCPIDDAPDGVYSRYKQWTIDPPNPNVDPQPNDCNGSNVINLITAGTDFTTDPHTLVGKTLPKVVGIVRPVNIGSFNVWIVYPRGKADLQTQ